MKPNSQLQLERKNVFALVRVSTTGQAEVEHGSLEQQRHVCKRYAEELTKKSGVLHQLLDEHIFEEDVSGRAKSLHKRTGLLAIRRAMRQGACGAVLIEKLDRLARDQEIARSFMTEAQELGIPVYEVESGLINMRDRGSRLSFNIKNMLAEEYSLELEEKITKKQREAMVNNGKDTSTCPILGLDAHPDKAGIYLKNDNDLEIVRDIFNKFLELRSYKALAEYSAKKDYRTKTRMIKERIVRGKRIASRQAGGQLFDEKSLRALLTNPKLRGCGFFKDTWNQFPDLQDERGMVCWKYQHGAVFEERFFDLIDSTIASIKGTRLRESTSRGIYLLSGVLKAIDGVPYYGTRAKQGRYHYYYNSSTKDRLPCDLIDEVVCNRVKQYLQESGVLRDILESAIKHQSTGLPAIEGELTRVRGRIKALEMVIGKFSTSLKEAALSGGNNLIAVCESLLEEKNKAETELEAEKFTFNALSDKKIALKDQFAGNSIEAYLRKALAKFDEKSDLQKKRIIQAIVPEVIVKSEDELVLMLNPIPLECHMGGNGVVLREGWRERRDLNPRPPA